MRRRLVILSALLFVLPLLGQAPPPKPPTADELWAALLLGNAQFVKGKVTYDRLEMERSLVRKEELPPITVLACSDSRVPPELAFNQSVGGLFVVRSAGNIADELGVASIEYALTKDWTRLLIVLGHEDCGAVAAAMTVHDSPSMSPAWRALVTRIRSSFVGIGYDAADPANLKKAIEANTRASAAHLLANSISIRYAVTNGRVKVVTAYYDLNTGAVKKIE